MPGMAKAKLQDSPVIRWLKNANFFAFAVLQEATFVFIQ